MFTSSLPQNSTESTSFLATSTRYDPSDQLPTFIQLRTLYYQNVAFESRSTLLLDVNLFSVVLVAGISIAYRCLLNFLFTWKVIPGSEIRIRNAILEQRYNLDLKFFAFSLNL